jgi:phosphatidylglycerophosphatase A
VTRLAVVLATVGGAGYAPVAPGTIGSAVGIAIYAATRAWAAGYQVSLLAAITVIGIWASSMAARHFQREDPGHVVIDEVAGQLLTLCLLQVGAFGMLVGFLLFRVFDIVKPWPARQLEALHGGLGIMADDLMAGVYGWIVMRVLIAAAPAAFS